MPMFLNATNPDIPSQQVIAHNIALRSLFCNKVFNFPRYALKGTGVIKVLFCTYDYYRQPLY